MFIQTSSNRLNHKLYPAKKFSLNSKYLDVKLVLCAFKSLISFSESQYFFLKPTENQRGYLIIDDSTMIVAHKQMILFVFTSNISFLFPMLSQSLIKHMCSLWCGIIAGSVVVVRCCIYGQPHLLQPLLPLRLNYPFK